MDSRDLRTRMIITDIGPDHVAVNTETGETLDFGRYGVWSMVNGRLGVIESGNDVDALLVKYSLSRSDIFLLEDGRFVPQT